MLAFTSACALLCGDEVDYAKQSSEIIVGTSSEEQLVGGAICRGSATEFDSPELIDLDRVARSILQCADELSGYGIERVDRAGIRVVRDQQRVAELSEVPRRDGETPRLIQRCAVRKLLEKGSVFAIDVDEPARSTRSAGERDVDEAAEVLNAEGSEAGRKCGVGKRLHQFEGAIVDVHLVVRIVGGKKNIPRRLAGNGQTRVGGPWCGDLNDGCIAIHRRSPGAD